VELWPFGVVWAVGLFFYVIDTSLGCILEKKEKKYRIRDGSEVQERETISTELEIVSARLLYFFWVRPL
jgi:hypothetical protein